jgi:hypothetical protein
MTESADVGSYLGFQPDLSDSFHDLQEQSRENANPADVSIY